MEHLIFFCLEQNNNLIHIYLSKVNKRIKEQQHSCFYICLLNSCTHQIPKIHITQQNNYLITTYCLTL